MEYSFRRNSLFYVVLLCFAGCATTTPYKPQGFTDKEFTMKQNDLRAVCQHLRMGSYITIKFYDDAVDLAKKPLKGTQTGYFYVYDKMMDTLSLASQPLTFSDRGVAYPLAAIESITPTQEAAHAPEPNIIIKAVENFIDVNQNDNERQLLTQ